MEVLTSALKMLGGLVLLIYGMKILSSNLKKLSGGKLEQILTNVTDNPFKGLIVGFLITVATQSSATTTVIVVGLVNSDILKLRSAIPIIMGANIGTTVNSQILRLTSISGNSWISLFTPATLAPIILLIGLILLEKAKNQKAKDIGQMVIGLGILFTGMITMVSMASTFADLPILGEILSKLSNPVLGVLAGAIVTAIVQSSSATVGILQALSTTGMVSYATTIPIILGQNIGTCITSILASLGGNKNAKRIASVHLYFNLIGTIIFMIAIYSYQHLVGFAFWDDAVDMGGIANFHALFNIVSTIILFPFIGTLEKLTMITVKDKVDENDEDANDSEYLASLAMLDENVTKLPGIAISNCMLVIEKMGEVSGKNYRRAVKLFEKYDMKKMEKIEEREKAIDKMEAKITNYLIELGSKNLSDRDNSSVTASLKMVSEFEKVGDYALRLAKTAEYVDENHIKFSELAKGELNTIYSIVEDTIKKTIKVVKNKDLTLSIEIQALRDLCEREREKDKLVHIKRLKDGKCNVESGIAFLEILTICEKILDHCFNVAIATSNYVTSDDIVTKQDYYKKVYKKNSKLLKQKLNEFSLKYEI